MPGRQDFTAPVPHWSMCFIQSSLANTLLNMDLDGEPGLRLHIFGFEVQVLGAPTGAAAIQPVLMEGVMNRYFLILPAASPIGTSLVRLFAQPLRWGDDVNCRLVLPAAGAGCILQGQILYQYWT